MRSYRLSIRCRWRSAGRGDTLRETVSVSGCHVVATNQVGSHAIDLRSHLPSGSNQRGQFERRKRAVRTWGFGGSSDGFLLKMSIHPRGGVSKQDIADFRYDDLATHEFYINVNTLAGISRRGDRITVKVDHPKVGTPSSQIVSYAPLSQLGITKRIRSGKSAG
jgi:hypothetical protein